MPFRRPPSLPRLFAALAAFGSLAACGASIQAVYEGDVRFEHCMALDSRPDVKPTIRRACWEEWSKFYTFGQTRDRVDYARSRIRQLGRASDFDDPELPAPAAAPMAVPEPTSVHAPPPMMLAADAGSAAAAPAPDGGPDAAADAMATAARADDDPPPGAACAGDCESARGACGRGCEGSSCERACEAKYRRCMRRCD